MDATFTVPCCICGCDAGACIPQRKYERQKADPLSSSDLQEMILFKVNGKCGYPLKDAMKKQYTGLDGRDDSMFVDFNSFISIRVEVRPVLLVEFNDSPEFRSQWLPYDKWTKQVGTKSCV